MIVDALAPLRLWSAAAWKNDKKTYLFYFENFAGALE